MHDIRLSELAFLQMVTKGDEHPGKLLFVPGNKFDAIRLSQQHLIDMVVHLLESGYLRVRHDPMQRFVAFLRGEFHGGQIEGFHTHEWIHPRGALENRLNGAGQCYEFEATYTGMRRIEELRDALRADRILDSLGILLDHRYYQPELRMAIGRSEVTDIAVLALDLDGMKPINDDHGHAAGDEILKRYMLEVRNAVDTHGQVFRRGGDEVCAVLPGYGMDRAAALAERIRAAIEGMKVEHEGRVLRTVTSSIGVAAHPPDPRSLDLEKIADLRQKAAKQGGKNRVVSTG